MGAFLEGPNRAAAFGTLAAAVGISDGTFQVLKQAYDIGAQVLTKLLSTTDGPLFGGALVTGAGAAVAGIAALVQALGLVDGQKSQFDLLYEKVRAELKIIEAEIGAASRHEDQKDLAAIAADAAVIDDVAQRYMRQVAAQQTLDVPEKDAFAQAALQSEQLVARFFEDAFWQRLADDKTVVQVVGIDAKRFAPPGEAADAGLVWDYRAAMPVLLKAIHARLSYLAAKDIHFRDNNADEIAKMADLVTRVHNRIQDGIKLIPAPPPAAGMWNFNPLPENQWFPDFWAQWGSPCGAVDTYGGIGIVEHFPGSQPEWHVYYTDMATFKFEGPQRFQRAMTDEDFATQKKQGEALRIQDLVYWRQFNFLFLVRSLRARKALEDRLGLPELRTLVTTLRLLSRHPDASTPLPQAIGGSLSDVVRPSGELLTELTCEPWWYSSMSAPDVPRGFTAFLRSDRTAGLTTEFARQFDTQPGQAPVASVARMVSGD